MLNAGVMATPFTLTQDGIELQYATNHVRARGANPQHHTCPQVGHFLLTKLLLPLVEKSAPSRIVTVSSESHT
jgi:retinol dehydrogenase-12